MAKKFPPNSDTNIFVISKDHSGCFIVSGFEESKSGSGDTSLPGDKEWWKVDECERSFCAINKS